MPCLSITMPQEPRKAPHTSLMGMGKNSEELSLYQRTEPPKEPFEPVLIL
jgi:hypothetical protein